MTAPISTFLTAPLEPAVRAALERLARAPGVRRIAVMPDVHLAHDVCIGTVVATAAHLYPAAVGGDIGCGVATLRLIGERPLDDAGAARLMQALSRVVPIREHRDPPPWPDHLAPAPPSGASSPRVAARQLGTLGRGNHFLELQVDPLGQYWLMVHSGSRGSGQAIRARHVGDHPLIPLAAAADVGAAYLADVAWAGEYARANRRALLEAAAVAVEVALGWVPDDASFVDCDHNHVALEDHDGPLWVHRKGAIRADVDRAGLIPGSMGSASYHTCGRGHAEGLRSSSHGAGRAMDRTTARRRITTAALAQQLRGVYFDPGKARRLVDEAPAAYRDIVAVMRAQRALTRVVRQVRPVLSFKGG